MRLKNYNEYSLEEKKILLLFWWNHFGKIPFTPEELEIFKKLVDTIPEDVMFLAVNAFSLNIANEAIITYMRSKRLSSLIDSIPREEFQKESFKKFYATAKESFIEILVITYNAYEENKIIDILVPIDDIIEVEQTKHKLN